MKKAASLILVVLSLSGCITTPGIEEPVVEECTLVTDQVAECVMSNDQSKIRDIFIVDMIGYKAVSPQDTQKVGNHHSALHSDLNACLKP